MSIREGGPESLDVEVGVVMPETGDWNDVRKGLIVSQEMSRQPPEARKSKETDFPLGSIALLIP